MVSGPCGRMYEAGGRGCANNGGVRATVLAEHVHDSHGASVQAPHMVFNELGDSEYENEMIRIEM